MYLRRLYSNGVVSIHDPVETLARVDTIPEASPPPEETVSGLWKEIRKYPKITLFCVGLMFSSMLGGYDTAISGNIIALPEFQDDFGELYDGDHIIPSLWLSLWNIATSIGLMGGSLLGGWLEDRVGRRFSLLTGSISSAGALFLCYFPNLLAVKDDRRALFFVGRIFQGLALGTMGSTSQTFMSEIAPPTLQGPVMALLPFGELLGELLGAAVVASGLASDTSSSYLNPIASQWAWLVIPFFMVVVIPESPPWLIRKKRNSTLTKEALRRLHTKKVDVDTIQTDLEELILVRHLNNNEAAPRYVDCFKGTNRRRTWIVAFTSMLPIFFGLPLLAQASYFAQNYGMSADLSLVLLLAGIIVGLIANGIGIWILSKVGRRILILTSLGISALLWLGMGIAGFWSGPATIWFSAASMICVVLANGLGAWPASYAVSSETSALHLRARSQGIGWFSYSFASGVMSFILPYIYNPDAGDLRGKTGFVLSGTCICGLVIAWFSVPEMRDRSNIDIDTMFTLRLPTRSFKRWSPSTSSTDVSDQDFPEKKA